jgi:hypothetical protein
MTITYTHKGEISELVSKIHAGFNRKYYTYGAFLSAYLNLRLEGKTL